MKTTFKNSKGEFSKENTNHFVICENENFIATIERKGQTGPNEGNTVITKMSVKCKNDLLSFNAPLFGMTIYCNYGNFRKDCCCYVNTFTAPTWREGFAAAMKLLMFQTDKYDRYVKEREQALINAEF